MLNLNTSLLGPLEQSIMECFWASGTQTSGEILKTLRKERKIAPTTVSTTLGRLHEHDLLTREAVNPRSRRPFWRYTARHASRAKLLADCFGYLCVQLGANEADRAEALALAALLGRPR